MSLKEKNENRGETKNKATVTHFLDFIFHISVAATPLLHGKVSDKALMRTVMFHLALDLEYRNK